MGELLGELLAVVDSGLCGRLSGLCGRLLGLCRRLSVGSEVGL